MSKHRDVIAYIRPDSDLSEEAQRRALDLWAKSQSVSIFTRYIENVRDSHGPEHPVLRAALESLRIHRSSIFVTASSERIPASMSSIVNNCVTVYDARHETANEFLSKEDTARLARKKC